MTKWGRDKARERYDSGGFVEPSEADRESGRSMLRRRMGGAKWYEEGPSSPDSPKARQAIQDAEFKTRTNANKEIWHKIGPYDRVLGFADGGSVPTPKPRPDIEGAARKELGRRMRMGHPMPDNTKDIKLPYQPPKPEVLTDDSIKKARSGLQNIKRGGKVK